jgi:hypothetical protein
MKPVKSNKSSLTKEENAQIVLDFFHRIMMHHAMWFAEVQRHLGSEKAFEVLEDAWTKSFSIQMNRLAKVLGFEIKDNIPKPLLDLPDELLTKLREAVSVNWLANDGVWFQAVEFKEGMADAKHCNDSCWGKFSPFEAWSVRKLLDLPVNPGLDGLKQALQFRLYAFINEQSFAEETENSFVFRMNKCRVQEARKRKGLADYPCKSGGVVEYTTFAETIDPAIKTECNCCPPDQHPEDYYCAWRFYSQ